MVLVFFKLPCSANLLGCLIFIVTMSIVETDHNIVCLLGLLIDCVLLMLSTTYFINLTYYYVFLKQIVEYKKICYIKKFAGFCWSLI